jgi:hypothetical protein
MITRLYVGGPGEFNGFTTTVVEDVYEHMKATGGPNPEMLQAVETVLNAGDSEDAVDRLRADGRVLIALQEDVRYLGPTTPIDAVFYAKAEGRLLKSSYATVQAGIWQCVREGYPRWEPQAARSMADYALKYILEDVENWPASMVRRREGVIPVVHETVLEILDGPDNAAKWSIESGETYDQWRVRRHLEASDGQSELVPLLQLIVSASHNRKPNQSYAERIKELTQAIGAQTLLQPTQGA